MNNARLFRQLSSLLRKKFFLIHQTRINRISRAMNSLHVAQSHRSNLAHRNSNVSIITHEIDVEDSDLTIRIA